MHDLVIRGGTVVDGTRRAAVRRRRRRRRRRDHRGRPRRRRRGARGDRRRPACSSRPGFVDVHTHYDGQVTWDPLLTPSSWHGVTTVVMGNCGVGFAPAAPDRRDWLIGLMEGVEDIPGTALAEGIRGTGRRSPSTSTRSTRMPRALDVGTQVPHGAVRATSWASAARATSPPRADDIDGHGRDRARRASRPARSASRRRARSRTAPSTASPCPGTFAAEDELFGIGRALGERRHAACSSSRRPACWARTSTAPDARSTGCAASRRRSAGPSRSRCSSTTGSRPVEADARPRPRGRRRGVAARPAGRGVARSACCSVCRRSTRSATGRATRRSPTCRSPSRWRACAIPSARRDPRRVARDPTTSMAFIGHGLDRIFPIGDPPDYEPGAGAEHRGACRARGPRSDELLYDLLLAHDGRELLLRPLLSYSRGTLDADARDARAPDDRARARRRRRALRRHLRRQHRRRSC